MTPYPPPEIPYPSPIPIDQYPIMHTFGPSSVNLVSMSAHSGDTLALVIVAVVFVVIMVIVAKERKWK